MYKDTYRRREVLLLGDRVQGEVIRPRKAPKLSVQCMALCVCVCQLMEAGVYDAWGGRLVV